MKHYFLCYKIVGCVCVWGKTRKCRHLTFVHSFRVAVGVTLLVVRFVQPCELSYPWPLASTRRNRSLAVPNALAFVTWPLNTEQGANIRPDPAPPHGVKAERFAVFSRRARRSTFQSAGPIRNGRARGRGPRSSRGALGHRSLPPGPAEVTFNETEGLQCQLCLPL